MPPIARLFGTGREDLPSKLQERHFPGTFLFAFEGALDFRVCLFHLHQQRRHFRRHSRLVHRGLKFLARDRHHPDVLSDGLSGDASPLVERNFLRAHDVDHVIAIDRVEQILGGDLGDVFASQ